MRTWRQVTWFVQGFISKYRSVVLVSFGLTIVAALFLGLVLPRLPKPKQVTYIAVVGKFTPTEIPTEIEKELGAGLITAGLHHEPNPGLAGRWEISDDGKKYKLFLIPNLKWSNGQKVALSDLSVNIPEVNIVKTEPNILEFELPEAFSPFLSVLTKPLIKDGTLSISKYSIGEVKTSGQFLSQVILEATDQRLIFRFYDSTSQAITAFKLGQIDRIGGLVEKPDTADWPNVTVSSSIANDEYVGLFYNNSDPLLKDKTVRQALSYAVSDKSFGEKRELSVISPESWAYNQNIKDYAFDLSRAKELLVKVIPKASTVTITISVTPELLSKAELIKKDWMELGINVDIRVVSSKPSDFQVLLYVQQTPHDPDQYPTWHSTQDTNFTHYESKKVDKLLEDGRITTDQGKRLSAYWDFQRFIAEDVPVTVLYHPRILTLERK